MSARVTCTTLRIKYLGPKSRRRRSGAYTSRAKNITLEARERRRAARRLTEESTITDSSAPPLRGRHLDYTVREQSTPKVQKAADKERVSVCYAWLHTSSRGLCRPLTPSGRLPFVTAAPEGRCSTTASQRPSRTEAAFSSALVRGRLVRVTTLFPRPIAEILPDVSASGEIAVSLHPSDRCASSSVCRLLLFGKPSGNLPGKPSGKPSGKTFQ